MTKKISADNAMIADTNEVTNNIPQVTTKSQCFIKRDGWTLSPQLPTEEGEYLCIMGGRYEDGKPFVFFTTNWFFPWQDEKYRDYPFNADNCICWVKLDAPSWADDLVPSDLAPSTEVEQDV